MSNINKSEHATKWIAVKHLSVLWRQAQRDYDEKRAARIGRELDPDYFGTITVTQPNDEGVHHVIDGQHRVGGVRIEWGDEQQVPCNVLNVSDPKRAAEIFHRMNGGRNRRNPSALAMFKTAVTAEFTDEVAVNKLVKGLGYTVSNDKHDGTIVAVGALMQVYRRYGLNCLKDTLMVLQALWGRSAASVDGTLITGFATFLHRYGAQVNRQRLVEKVSREYTPGRFIGAAKTRRETSRCSLSEGVVQVLIDLYNHRLRTGQITPETSRKSNGKDGRHTVKARATAALDTHAGVGLY